MSLAPGVYPGHVGVTARGPGVYGSAPRDDRMKFFTKYVRTLNLEEPAILAHAHTYGVSLLPEQDVVTILDRAMNQEDLYA